MDCAVLRAAGRHHGASGTLSQRGPPCAACAVAGPGSHGGSALAPLALTRCVNLYASVSAPSCRKSCWCGAGVVPENAETLVAGTLQTRLAVQRPRKTVWDLSCSLVTQWMAKLNLRAALCRCLMYVGNSQLPNASTCSPWANWLAL